VRLNDFPAGRRLRVMEASGCFTLAPAASPDGRTLAIAGDRPAIRIWDAETGAEQESIDAGAGMPRAVAFSPDGTALAVGTWMSDGQTATVALWSWPGRHRLAILEGHRGQINALAFTTGGSSLAAADSAGEVRIWDVAAARERARVRAHSTAVTAMAASPDGRRLATASYLDGAIRLWDPRTGEPRGSLPNVATGVTALAFSPDGRMLAMARGDGVASLRHVASGLEAGAVRAPSGSLQSVAFSPDGSLLATGGIDGSTRLWDVARILDGGPAAP
jgi:WD40 repeat protein